jgi:hypothetical protein
MDTIPSGFTDSGDEIMSNFDHKIDQEVVTKIKGNPLWAGYPGWSFYGKVWWSNEQWHCDVFVYGSLSKTISEDTLEEIMSGVSSEFGQD